MNQADEEKLLRKELAEKEPMVKDLGKFDPDNFDTYEDAFLNLLSQKYGIQKEPLCYIVHPDVVPIDFSSPQEEHMFQLPLTGPAF
jgi:hypothetical protein